MKAIQRLRKSGMTTSEIATAINDKSGGYLVRMYDRLERFPSKRTYLCILETAESRGITLLARDFVDAADVCDA